MKIQVSKDYQWKQMWWETDMLYARRHEDVTYNSDYSPVFEEVEVTEEELIDYINKGYAIKINC